MNRSGGWALRQWCVGAVLWAAAWSAPAAVATDWLEQAPHLQPRRVIWPYVAGGVLSAGAMYVGLKNARKSTKD